MIEVPIIAYQEPMWLGIALLCGFAAVLIRLPPMVGFLAAGFILNGLGANSGPFLGEIADLGVTLLLFSIGLKLNVRSLFRPEIWAVTLIHMSTTVLLLAALGMAITATGVALFAGLTLQSALIAGFALSFSSTVFAVKILEAKGEMGSRHGQIAIGILIMQDIVAVIFLAASSGKLPSLWAFSLLGLIPARHLLHLLLKKAGHGELLILTGFALAMIGSGLFDAVGLKGDLGALAMGILLSGQARSSELSRSILNFKELLLIGFFLNIGLAGLPGANNIVIAVMLLAFLPIKTALFFKLLLLFRLRARPAGFTALALGNYSEFGLIVASVAATAGWLPYEWIATIAITMALSFVIAAPMNSNASGLFRRYRTWLEHFERSGRLPEDAPVSTGAAQIAIFGMGRVGTSTYEEIVNRMGPDAVVGVDFNEKVVARHLAEHRYVIIGDAADPEFWERYSGFRELRTILLNMPNHREQMIAIRTLQDLNYQGHIAATARYPDEVEELRDMGIISAYSIYTEAGKGFADEVCGAAAKLQ